MSNQECLAYLIQRLKQVPGKFFYEDNVVPAFDLAQTIKHETFKDSVGNKACVIVALFRHEYRKHKNQAGAYPAIERVVFEVNNGAADLHHLAYMLNLPHKFLMQVETAGKAQLDILTCGFEDNWEQHPEIAFRVQIRKELEKLVL